DGLLAADDDRQLACQDVVDLLRRRGVRPRATARQEVRNAEDQGLRTAHLGAENAERLVVAMVRRLVRLRLGKLADDHQNFSPLSIRNFWLGSTIATSRTIQPSPRSQFHGKNANVQRRPVTLSSSPPTFSMPRMPALNRMRC